MFDFVEPPEKSILRGDGTPTSYLTLHPGEIFPFENSHIIRSSTLSSTLPFLVTCPHAGIKTLGLTEDVLAEGVTIGDVLRRGDMFTDWLTVNAPEIGATQVISIVAPSFLNVGRRLTSIHPDDVRGVITTLKTNPDDKYVANGIGQGLVAVKSLYDGKPIYKPEHIPDEVEIETRIAKHYEPFHQVIEDKVSGHLQRSNYCLIFDIHSAPSEGPPSDIDAGQ